MTARCKDKMQLHTHIHWFTERNVVFSSTYST